MARFYGQNIEIPLHQCHVYTRRFHVMLHVCTIKDVRCMQRDTSKRCAIKLKDEEANVIQVKDVR